MASKDSHNSIGQVGMGLTTAEVGLVKSLISQRRRQVLLHAYLYYDLGREIVSDQQWDTWARELVRLQKAYPDIAEYCVEACQFRDFDATTGFDFEYPDWVKRRAEMVLRWHEKSKKI